MADRQLFANNAVSLLMAPLSPADTTLTVMPGHGAMFPQPTLPGDYFLITLEDQAATTREIIKVTGRTGDVFTGIVRAQEGTTAQSWGASLGNDTLVDHRVTAETLRRSMQLPESSLDDLTDVSAPAPAVNDVLTWDGTSWVAQPVSSGPAPAWIYGQNDGPVSIDPGWTLPISQVTYSDFNRGFKFFVTVVMPANGTTKTFEMLVTITGNIAAETESAEWVTYANIGYQFQGTASVALNKPANLMTVTWQNLESQQVRVLSTRIQHVS